MRVRFFNTYEVVTTFYRDLLPYLAEREITSEVLISAAEYRQGGRGRLSDVFSSPDIRVQYLPALGIQPAGRIQKACIMLAYILASMWKTLFGAATNVNFFLTQPPLFNLWGWVLKKLRHQPYICLVMDIYPDVAVLDGILPPHSWVTNSLTRLSHFALKQADAVVVIGRCMAERVAATGVLAENIHTIPNWANPDVVFPVSPDENSLRQELGLSNKFVVQYSGNMGASHNFDDILEVVYRCQDEPKLHFLFIGGGRRLKEIEEYISTRQLHNITLLPFQPLERLAESLSLGDVHFVSLRDGFEGYVVPSKVYGVLSAGRPVIYQGNAKGEVALMIQESGAGVVVQPNSSEQLEQVIRNYVESPTLTKQQGLIAHNLTKEKYASTAILNKYYRVIEKVVNV